MDYENEVKNLQKNVEIFKPTTGSYTIVPVTEPEATEYQDIDTGEITPQIQLLIEVDKVQHGWFIGKGKTTSSLFGQLMILGKAQGRLVGMPFTLIVKRSKGKNEYTIPEAIELLKEEK